MTDSISTEISCSQTLFTLTVSRLEHKPLTVEDLTRILGSTVKHDDANKVITFLSMLLTYTEEDQINIGFLAESSTGKSYIPLELSDYFPKEDIIEIGYASPTSFFHDYHKLVETSNKKKGYLVDLHQKILIFIDLPHDLLLKRLRPILSHDKKIIPLMITDRRRNAALRTKHILIQGFPTVIFASAKFNLSEQEKTRLLLLSPEVTQEKLIESVSLKVKKESDRQAFRENMQSDHERRLLVKRVLNIKQAKIKQIIIPEKLGVETRDRFIEKHKKLIPRHQRDISRLLAMIKAHALLNFNHREKRGDCIIVTKEDIDAGFKIYAAISEANELGLSPEIHNIFKKLKPYIEDYSCENLMGITIADFQIFYERAREGIYC